MDLKVSKQSSKPRARLKIALISMPFASLDAPSIQLGILKPILIEKQYVVDDLYLNLSFAKFIGIKKYERVVLKGRENVGDWIFSSAAFGFADKRKNINSLKSLLRVEAEGCKSKGRFEKLLLEIRDIAPVWLDFIVKNFQWCQYNIVAFSCCYDQLVASIAMAQLIKKINPKSFVIFGGTAVAGQMGEEVTRKVSAVNCIVQGEGEDALLEILKLYEKGISVPRNYSAKNFIDLDKLPPPDYDSYFKAVRNDQEFESMEKGGNITLLYETSRGCWWGEYKQCVFCGIQKENLIYREKKIEKILSDIDFLSRRYRRYEFRCVDLVLSKNYYKSLLPALVSEKTSYKFLFEIRAGLSFDEVGLLSQIGMKVLECGIESLNTKILTLLNKGTTATLNLNLLKWSGYFGLDIFWNILYGIPGEKPEYYDEIIEMIPKIYHLKPPNGISRIRIDRFSPLFNKYKSSNSLRLLPEGFSSLKHSRQYDLTYPVDWDYDKIAYFFEWKVVDEALNERYDKLSGAVSKWKKSWNRDINKRAKLKLKKGITFGHIIDTRTGALNVTEISGDYFKIAKILDEKARDIDAIAKITGFEVGRVKEICDNFKEQKFIIKLDHGYYWLPISEKT